MDEAKEFPAEHAGFKVIVVGNRDVGKTSLLIRLVENNFTSAPESTGSYLDFCKAVVSENGTEVNFYFRDPGGSVSFAYLRA